MRKKKHSVKKKENVLLFPGVENRLREEGLEALENKQYARAVELLKQSLDIDDTRQEVYLGLVISYFEMGNFRDAKSMAKEMLKGDIGDYFQIIELYITILVQLHEYSEIVTTLEALLEEEKEMIPPEKFDHFERMLEFSRRMVIGEPPQPEEDFKSEWDEEVSTFSLRGLSEQEQLIQIAGLAHQNIRPHIIEIKQFLKDEKEHPFLKTMLVLALKEQEVQDTITVEKFGCYIECKPYELQDVHNNEYFNGITEKLDEQLSQYDPILLDNIQTMLERHFYLLFPLILQPEQITLWSAAYHLIGLQYFGSAVSLEKIAEMYNVNYDEISEAIEEIERLEEISSPII